MNNMSTNGNDTSDEAGAKGKTLDELVETCQELIKKEIKLSDDDDSSDMNEGAVGQSSAGNGFDRGLEVEKVMGCYDGIDGKRIYGIKFKGSSHVEHIPSVVARFYIPQVIIDFYLERLKMMEFEETE